MNEPNLEQWNHWLLFYQNREVGDKIITYAHHIIGYIEEPNGIDIQSAITKVTNDPEFGLGAKLMKYIKYVVLDKDDGLKVAEYLIEDGGQIE